MRAVIVGILLVVAGLRSAQAESLGTAEGAAASNMAMAYKIFREMNGRPPASWPELESIFKRPANEVFPWLQPATRYAFLETPLDVPGRKGRIVILSRSPFHNQYKMFGFFGPITGSLPSSLGRYAIVADGEGEVHSLYISETEVQKWFAEAGGPLPAADPLGPRPYEIQNKTRLYYWIGGAALVVIFLGWMIIRKFRGGVAAVNPS